MVFFKYYLWFTEINILGWRPDCNKIVDKRFFLTLEIRTFVSEALASKLRGTKLYTLLKANAAILKFATCLNVYDR